MLFCPPFAFMLSDLQTLNLPNDAVIIFSLVNVYMHYVSVVLYVFGLVSL